MNKIGSLLFTSETIKPLANHGLVWAGHVLSAHGLGGGEVGDRDMGWEVLCQQWVILKVPSQSGAEGRPPKA